MNRTQSKYNVPIYPHLLDSDTMPENKNNLKNQETFSSNMEESFVEYGKLDNELGESDLKTESMEEEEVSSLLLSHRSSCEKECGEIIKKKVSSFLKENMVENPESPRSANLSDRSLYEDLFSSKSINRESKENGLTLTPVSNLNKVNKFSVVEESGKSCQLSQLISPTVYLETDLGMIELWSNGDLYKVHLNYNFGSKISNVEYTNWYVKYQYDGNDVLRNNMNSLEKGVKKLVEYCEWVNQVGTALFDSSEKEFEEMIKLCPCEEIFLVHKFVTRKMSIILVIHKDHSITIMAVKSDKTIPFKSPLKICFSNPKCLMNTRESEISEKTFQKLASIYTEYWFMNVGDL